ncbi:MAG: glycine cleavage system protein H [Bacteroidia bacterium]|nr:MAG: glycine cleavage system protein H [Bacteroidia bacterium]PIE86467.1 MAG: glycine cleavage system protein H [Bacteroidia bacterium]
MNTPAELKYTSNHEWIKIEGDEAFVGISEYAQSQLGDVVFVEIETEGETIDKGESFGTIEAVKTVADVYMPVSGKVLEVNPKLADNPEIVNQSPYEEGWLVKIKITNADEIKELLSAEDYKKTIA